MNLEALELAILQRTPETWDENVIPIILIEKPGAKKKGQTTLLMEPAQDIDRFGDCPGGTYRYIDSAEEAVYLLDYWTLHEAWAAIDLETGVAYRETTNSEGKIDKVFSSQPDPFTSPIYLCSISVKPGESVVFDMRTLMEDSLFCTMFRAFLTKCKLISHNSLFESSFLLAAFGVVPNIAFDTMVAHQILTAGMKDVGEKNTLEYVVSKYFGLEFNKTYQKYFLKLHPTSPIRNEAIVYSAGDVCLLLELAKKLEAALKEKDLWRIWVDIEQPFLEEVVRSKIHGIPLNLDLLEDLRDHVSQEVEEAKKRFADLVGWKTVSKKGKEPYQEPNVNIASPSQLLKWFNENGVKIKGTKEEILQDIVIRHPNTKAAEAAEAILEGRGSAKFLSTYINSFLGKSRNTITGRIHPNWKQASTDTGRMACTDPSIQNIPSDKVKSRIRNSFVAPPGFKLIIADYSQFEVRALAELAGEGKMISVFQEGHAANLALKSYCKDRSLSPEIAGLKSSDKETDKEKYTKYCEDYPELDELVTKLVECDFHTRTASTLLKIPVSEVTKEQRKKAKTITFALPYGAGPPGVARQAGIPVKEAEGLLNHYYSTYKATKFYLDKCREQAKMGFTSTPAGRKRFYPRPDMEKIRESLAEQKEEYLRLHKEAAASVKEQIESIPDENIKKEGDKLLYLVDKIGWTTEEEWVKSLLVKTDWAKTVDTWHITDPIEIASKKVRYLLGEIERAGTNHPIQGINADATKVATILMGRRLRQLDPRCAIMLWVHDEIVVSVPEELVDLAIPIVEGSMIEAAERWIQKVPIEVSVTVSNHWLK